MALRKVRLDLNKPVKLTDVFMGIGLQSKYESGALESVQVDGESKPFTVGHVTKPICTARVTDKGTYTDQVRLTATVKGLYDEVIELEFIYSTFKDKTYKRERVGEAMVELRCTNLSALKYPPRELYVMVSASFKSI